jgi:hypothetical protein
MHEVKDRIGLLEELHRIFKRDGILSAFTMHTGTDKFMGVMRDCGLGDLRYRYNPLGFRATSEILNFTKC